MNAQEPPPTHLDNLVVRFKIVGWLFLVGGSLLCVDNIYREFHPAAPVGNVPPPDLASHVGSGWILLGFPVVGAFLTFIPKQTLWKGLDAFNRFMSAGV